MMNIVANPENFTLDTDEARPVDLPEIKPRYIEPGDWDQYAVQFRDVIHEQTQCFNALRWAPDQLERIGFFKNGKILSGVVVLVIKLPVLNVGIAFVKWGPLWRKYNPTLNKHEEKAVFVETVKHLRRIYAEEGGLYLTFYPRADPEISDFEVETFESFGFTPGEELDAPSRYFVNTAITPDEMRASLTPKWRYNLKRSEKAGVQTRLVEGQEGLNIFRSLYKQMLSRKGFHDTSAVSTLEDLMKASEPSLRPLIFVAEHEGVPVSAGVVDIGGERAVSLYAATSDEALPLRAGYNMHWASVVYLTKIMSNRWYDLGGADADTQLHHFKNGFVGKLGKKPVTPPYYNYGHTLKARSTGQLLYAMRRFKRQIFRLLHRLK